MKLKITNQTENKLFNRKEIQAEIKSDSTPNKTEVLKLLGKETYAPEQNIQIKGIHGKFGSKTFIITANIYASKEDKEKTEQKSKKEKTAEPKSEKSAEQPAQEKPTEEPVQEKKPNEENKTEEKTE